MTLSLNDIAWHRSVGQLIDALDKPNFWTQLVRLLDQYVPCDSWVALLFSADQYPQVFAECPGEDGGPDQLFQDYLRGLYLLDPFYIASREQSGTGLYRLSEVAPEHFELTEYYQRYFRVNVAADEIQFNCQLEGVRTLCLSLGSKQHFSAGQIALLSLLQQGNRPQTGDLHRNRKGPQETHVQQAGDQIPVRAVFDFSTGTKCLTWH